MDDIEFLIAKYDRNVPRYTSYPTANHFSGAVGAAAQGEWLGGLSADAPLSLYLHIPFCKALCRYCGCHMRVARTYDPARVYAQSLLREIDSVAERIGAGRAVAHIHWGGGTPTFLDDSDIAAIFARLRERFVLQPDCEIAMEIDPRTLGAGRAAFLAGQGVNRVSFGVQDFDPAVQEAIGRVQPFAVVRDAVDALRAAGISAINFDLIYGLPEQNADSIRRTMAQVEELSPERLAVFGYAHVPWFKPQQKILERYALPGPAQRFALCALVAAELTRAGYVAVGLDHFARGQDPLVCAMEQKTLRRNFQGYTTDSAATLIGFGASSISAMPGGYVQNDPNIEGYRKAVDAGGLSGMRGIVLTDEDRIRARIIESLMCFLEVDPAAHGLDVSAEISERIAEFTADGLAEWRGGVLHITERGRPFARAVCTAFDARYARSETRHARAV